MKKICAILIVGCFWLYGFTGKIDSDIFGTWKGGYGTGAEVVATTVNLKPDRSAIVYENCNDESLKSAGIYELKGDTAFVLIYYSTLNKKKLLMEGNINRSKTFVDGVWQAGEKTKGSFYLEKQAAEANNQN